jgi:hypothetical protein
MRKILTALMIMTSLTSGATAALDTPAQAAARQAWMDASPNDTGCMAKHHIGLGILIRRGIQPNSPEIADVRAACWKDMETYRAEFDRVAGDQPEDIQKCVGDTYSLLQTQYSSPHRRYLAHCSNKDKDGRCSIHGMMETAITMCLHAGE